MDTAYTSGFLPSINHNVNRQIELDEKLITARSWSKMFQDMDEKVTGVIHGRYLKGDKLQDSLVGRDVESPSTVTTPHLGRTSRSGSLRRIKSGYKPSGISSATLIVNPTLYEKYLMAEHVRYGILQPLPES